MTGVSRMTNRGSMVALLLEAVLVPAVFAVSGQAARAREPQKFTLANGVVAVTVNLDSGKI